MCVALCTTCVPCMLFPRAWRSVSAFISSFLAPSGLCGQSTTKLSETAARASSLFFLFSCCSSAALICSALHVHWALTDPPFPSLSFSRPHPPLPHTRADSPLQYCPRPHGGPNSTSQAAPPPQPPPPQQPQPWDRGQPVPTAPTRPSAPSSPRAVYTRPRRQGSRGAGATRWAPSRAPRARA